MQIIENPPKTALQNLQEVLEKERPEGIVDIWVCVNPFYLAVECAGSIVGVASISLGDDAAEIYKLYVAPDHRRSGVARKLFDNALNFFCQHGIKEVFVETTSEAGRLWFQSATSGLDVNHYYDNKYSFRLDC
jgi:N-acetylglutamate synthase-like GNAT family acetyltransferase